jgi:diguanylate cyclase (GGDEF)-like protein/PAS domain S-box-containing protein
MAVALVSTAAIARFGAHERFWYAIAVLAPLNVALGSLAMVENGGVQLYFLVLCAVWGAIHLPSRIEVVAIAATAVAAIVPLAAERAWPGAAPGAEVHEAVVLMAMLTVSAGLAHAVAGELRRTAAELAVESANMNRVAEGLGAHLWAGVRTLDDVYRPTFLGPGLSVLAGGQLPEEPEAHVAAFRERIHPDDRERFDRAFSLANADIADGREDELEYRVAGLDGVTRWIRTRWLTHRQADGTLFLDGIASEVTREVRLREAAEHAAHELAEQAAALRESEQRFRLMIENLPSGAVHRDGDLLYLNAAAGRITGLDPSRPIALGDWQARLFGDVSAGERPAVPQAGPDGTRESVIRRGDGVERVVEFAAFRYDHGEVWLLHDVTDRVEAENERRRAEQELRRLATTDPVTGLANRRRAVDRMQRALRRDHGGAVVMLDIDHFKRINDAFGHAAGDAVLADVAARLRGASRRGDLVARWGGEEFCVFVSDARCDTAVLAAGERLRAAVRARPLILPDGSSLPVTVSAGGALLAGADATVDALVEAADRALYVAKRRGRDQVRLASEVGGDEALEDTDTTRLAQALALAMSIREGVPELHCQQVADLAGRVAEQLGLPAAVVRRCRLGGWLHDIGKIAVPDAILGKPGALDADEWRTMRCHPAIGDELASRIPGLDDLRGAIRHHHERWDGSGYPDGLAGEAIPVEGRIVAAADAYSAITSDRVYRRAAEQQRAMAELRASAGSHLDPRVVEALVAVLERGRGRNAA